MCNLDRDSFADSGLFRFALVIFLSLSLVYALTLTLHPKPGILAGIQVHGTVSMWRQIEDPKPSMQTI
jgi:hypothetical protein